MADRMEPPECSFTVEGSSIRSDGTILRRVSGTMIGGILGISPFSTPFSVACDIMGLGRPDVSDKPAVKTGKVLESRVVEYLNRRYPNIGTFVPAEDMFEARRGPHSQWASDWEDDTFTGHVDGAVLKDDGQAYILEVKTSAYMAAWEDGVPDYYYWQVALYNHFLTHQDKAYVALGIVDKETHDDPDSWVPSDENVVLFEVDVDQEHAAEVFADIRDHWYAERRETNLTPPYDPLNYKDVALYNHLVNVSTDEDTMRGMVDAVADIEAQISERSRDIDLLEQQKTLLRNSLKDYLSTHTLAELPSKKGGYKAVLGKQTRRRVSATLLRDAGIDPEPYMETTVTETFTIKRVETNDLAN